MNKEIFQELRRLVVPNLNIFKLLKCAVFTSIMLTQVNNCGYRGKFENS